MRICSRHTECAYYFADLLQARLPLLVDLLLELLDWFSWAHAADRRPEARRLTLGCAAIVLCVCAAVIVWVALRR